MQRLRSVNVRASGSPFDRHRSKVRELLGEIKARREKYEKANTEFLLKNQVILKQIFQDEIDYYKGLCSPAPEPELVEEPEESIAVEPDVIISDSYDADSESN